MTETLPYPAMGGKDIRNWQNINALMSIGEVGVFGLMPNDLGQYESPLPGLAIWKSSDFRQVKEAVAARAWLLEPTGHPSDMYYSEVIAAELERLVADFKPHVAVLERLPLHRYISVLRRYNCRIVLDCHNVEAAVVREIANSALGDDLPSRLIRNTLPERTRLVEQKATDSVDSLWVCSSDDAVLIKEMYRPSTPIYVIPNAVEVDYYEGVRFGKHSPHEGKASKKRTVIFPASFRWAPNVKAAFFLIEEVFPLLVKIYPDCLLLLVGSNPTAQMIESAKKDSRIIVTGLVPDVRPYLSAASLMVVPLFQGSGTRLKILEALASNIPVVSTAKGAEGLDVENAIHLLIAETLDEFIDAVQRLWTDQALVEQLTKNGLSLVKQRYSCEAVRHQIENAICELGSCG